MIMQKIFKKSDSIVAREIGDEVILVPIKQQSGDLENIYTLNPLSTFIWQQIDGQKSVQDILDAIVDAYDVSESQAEVDLKNYLEQLGAIGAIIQEIYDLPPHT